MKTSQLASALHLLLVLLLQLQLHHQLIYAQPETITSSANLSTTWTICCDSYRVILENTIGNINLTCGFRCKFGRRSNYCFLTVDVYKVHGRPLSLWSANRDRPVGENATLQLTNGGDLVLKDADGTLVWSTNTIGKAVAGRKLTEMGELMLFDANNTVVWQSFDHPTYTLVSGQSLFKGRRLTADTSDWNSTRGPIVVSLFSDSFGAFVDSNPLQLYFSTSNNPHTFPKVTSKALPFVADASSSSEAPRFLDYRDYPTVCGSYGIGQSRQCSCLETSLFKPVSGSYGICSPVSPLSCESPQKHRLLELGFVGSFISTPSHPNITTLERCKEACLLNCSCRAALFRSDSYSDPSNGLASYKEPGTCTAEEPLQTALLNYTELSLYKNISFWLKKNKNISFVQWSANSARSDFYPDPSNSLASYEKAFSFKHDPSRPTAYINVQVNVSKTSMSVIVGATIGAVVVVLVIIRIAFVFCRKSSTRGEENNEEEDFLQLTGVLTRFSYEYMRSATKNFDKRLGCGGFGSVFDGVLADGTRVAIKQLETITQGKKEFLTEVETIGSIHHLNLVRLLGFCAEKSHMLLVYEHMINGSLDKWIFRTENNHELSWEVLRKIIHQVAKGLTYLHEECRQKIVHLDIKPENILLDSNFNAKVADFGLAKLIDRDQSAVVTMMRGTPGYLAPEWLLTSMITEKVDVYSFGVVVVEIVCGTKNVDFSKPEGCSHLLPLIKEKANAGELLDVVDKRKRDVHRDGKDLEEMLKLAIWCVQYDPSKRPSMSTVVKVLEGTIEVTLDLDFNLGIPVPNCGYKIYGHSGGSTPLIPSVLS